MRVPSPVTGRTNRVGAVVPMVQSQDVSTAATSLARGLGELGNSLVDAGGYLRQQKQNADRFRTMQSYSDFVTRVDLQLNNMKRDYNPADANWAELADTTYSTMEQEWLSTVQDDLYDEFATRVASTRNSVMTSAQQYQYDTTDAYMKEGIAMEANKAKLALDQDGSALNLDAQRASLDELINASGLNVAEQISLRRQYYAQLEAASYRSEVRAGNIDAAALGVGEPARGTAQDLIKEAAGPNVNPNLTYEENNAVFAERASAAEAVAKEALGSDTLWMAIPDYTRAAIIASVDANDGLPDGIKNAIQSGDIENIATAIENAGGTNSDVLADVARGLAPIPERELETDPRYANIPYEDRLALRADADRQAASAVAESQKAIQARNQALINDLQLRIADGKAGQFEIDQLREQGVMTQTADVLRSQEILRARDKGLKDVQLGQQLLASGLPFNPADTDHKNALNALVGQDGLARIKGLDEAYVRSYLVPLVEKAQDLPTDVVGQLDGMTRASDPRMALFAYDTLAQLQEVSPKGFSGRTNQDLASDVQYWRSRKDYYTPEQLMQQLGSNQSQETRVLREGLKTQAEALLKSKDDPTPTALSAFDQGWLGGGMPHLSADPAAAAAFGADFQALFVTEFQKYGNADEAKKSALELMKTEWGVTKVGAGNVLMKYPPEQSGYKPINNSYDWITQQGRTDLQLKEGENFQLLSDDQTRAEIEDFRRGGEAPSYLAVIIGTDGNYRAATTAEGKPQRLFFEVTPELRAEEVRAFDEANLRQRWTEFQFTFDAAKQLSLSTGTPIPQDLLDQYNEFQTEIAAFNKGGN